MDYEAESGFLAGPGREIDVAVAALLHAVNRGGPQGEVGPGVHALGQGHDFLNRSRCHDRCAAVEPGTPGGQPGRCTVQGGTCNSSAVRPDRDDGTAACDDPVTDRLSRHDPDPSSGGTPMYARRCAP